MENVATKKAPDMEAFGTSLIVRGDSVKEFSQNLRVALDEMTAAFAPLKPKSAGICPHCGADDLHRHSAEIYNSDETVYWVTCDTCGYQED